MSGQDPSLDLANANAQFRIQFERANALEAEVERRLDLINRLLDYLDATMPVEKWRDQPDGEPFEAREGWLFGWCFSNDHELFDELRPMLWSSKRPSLTRVEDK